MAARRVKPPRLVPQRPATKVADPTTERALGELRTAIGDRASLEVVTADLVVGTTAVRHSLGRAPRFIAVTPTVANASFAWARSSSPNSHPERQVLIDVVGVAQPGASILVT